MAAATALPVAASRDQTRRLLTEDLERQHGFEPLDIEGAIPVELRGTLYRNGPGQFGQFGTRYTHPFEGDGAITAVRFEAGTASGACRVTETAGLREERAAARLLYGFSAPWLRRVRNMLAHRHKNVANTSVMLWQGRLFALMEAGLPTEIDPQELGCLGESTLDRTIVSWFSAHPHRVAARRAVYNFGLEMGRVTRLHLYELPDVGAARHLGAVELPGPPMLHDFIATETHLVFFVSPVRIDVPRMLLQLGDFRQMFRYRPELGTEVLCVPIDRPDEVVRFTVDAFYQWHFTNAFTRGGQLIVDYIHYRTFDSFYELGGAGDGGLDAGHPHRAVIDLQRRRLHTEPTSERKAEFPVIASDRAGSEHARTYLVLDELSAVGVLDAQRGTIASHTVPITQRITEPVFVARPGATREDDGWLLALGHDGASRSAFVAIYDAARVPDGPIARAWFDHHVPITFHGTFAGVR
jgi:all-trans-8'-apo-beta-carotenal 15,15'-oxygenase